jgi:hypothetical protein
MRLIADQDTLADLPDYQFELEVQPTLDLELHASLGLRFKARRSDGYRVDVRLHGR